MDFSYGADYYEYSSNIATYVSGCPYPLYKIFYDDRGYPYYYGKWGGSANMDAGNYLKTEKCMNFISDYMLNKGVGSYSVSWESIGTYDGMPVVVRYVGTMEGRIPEPSAVGIPM